MTKNNTLEKPSVGDFVPPQGQDGEHFSEAWELAVNYEAIGRNQEAVDNFLLAAALLEKSGQHPLDIYKKIIEIDSQHSMAASRLNPEDPTESQTKIFVSHVLSRHSLSNTRALLQDERNRQWVTPPREKQKTCPECGMGVPAGNETCAMCGALTKMSYRKRTTASYGLMGVEIPQIPLPPSVSKSAEPQQPTKETPEKAVSPDASAPSKQPQRPAGSPFVKEVDVQAPAADPSTTPASKDSEPSKNPRVVLLSCDGSDEVLATSEKKEVLVGTHSDCFGHKEQNSQAEEKHARILWTGETFLVTDLESRSGIYLKLQSAYSCESPRLVQIGSQTLILSRRTGDRPGFRVGHVGPHGREICVMETSDETLTLGRSDSTIAFPEDPYLSSPHSQISLKGALLEITDLSSRWGTYVKMPKETPLKEGSIIRVGRLLLRLETT